MGRKLPVDPRTEVAEIRFVVVRSPLCARLWLKIFMLDSRSHA
jgi:hypothetical protein